MYQEPPISETLNPIIAQLGQTIRKIKNPLEDYQMSVLKAISDNPQLIQQFANMEYSNPGFLQNMGFGNVGKLIGSVEPDLKTKYEQQYGPIEIQAKGQKVQNEATVQSGISKKLAGPEGEDITRKAAGLPTVAGERIEKATATQEEGKADLTPMEVTVKKQQLSDYLKIMKKWPELAGLDPEYLVEHIGEGNNAAATAALLANPTTSPWMKEIFDNVRLNRSLDNRREMATLRFQNNIYQDREAYQSYTNSGGTGSIQSWKGHLFDPVIQQREADLVSGKIKPEDDFDQQLLAINTFNKTNQSQKFRGAIAQYTGVIQKNATALVNGKFASESDRQRLVDEMNKAYADRAKITGETPITAKVENYRSFFGIGGKGTHPFAGGVVVNWYRGKQRLDDDEAATLIENPPEPDMSKAPPTDTTKASTNTKPTAKPTASKFDTDANTQGMIARIRSSTDPDSALKILQSKNPNKEQMDYIRQKLGVR